MNEIIVTIINGLPYVAVALLCAAAVIGYSIVLGWCIDHEHNWCAIFLYIFLIFLFISSSAYLCGCLL